MRGERRKSHLHSSHMELDNFGSFKCMAPACVVYREEEG